MTTTHEVVDRYYDYVNRGDWEGYLTLFADDVVTDEQLAGHLTGVAVLRAAVDGIADGYSRFTMQPQRVVVDGDAAVVVWRFLGANAAGVPVAYANDPERLVIGANYFQVQNGKIVYMRTIHDSAPFAPVINQNQPS